MLKTDYRDAMYDGARKYILTNNPDGTTGIADATKYTQTGDQFGANDINTTNDTINRRLSVRNIMLKAGSWSASYPYTQAVGLNVTAGDNIKIIGVCNPDGADLATVKALNKAAGYLMHNPGGVDDGQVTFKAYKKPTVDLEIAIEGVQ